MTPRRFTVLTLGLAMTLAHAAEPAAATDQPAIAHGGQTFALASRSTTGTVETDEYAVTGEKLSDWTQLVTVQRLTLGASGGLESFVTYFKQRITEDGATLEILAHRPTASVFAVRFPKSERNEEQVMVCLAFADRTLPQRLNIVQYAIKPARTELSLVAGRITSWRDKFLAQASLEPE